MRERGGDIERVREREREWTCLRVFVRACACVRERNMDGEKKRERGREERRAIWRDIYI